MRAWATEFDTMTIKLKSNKRICENRCRTLEFGLDKFSRIFKPIYVPAMEWTWKSKFPFLHIQLSWLRWTLHVWWHNYAI